MTEIKPTAFKASTAALKLRDAAYKKRTGQDALDIPDAED